jgi:hypothetical protein
MVVCLKGSHGDTIQMEINTGSTVCIGLDEEERGGERERAGRLLSL